MINLQNPQIPPPTQAIEIDKAVYLLQLELSNKLGWLSHDYGRAYRFFEKEGRKLYFPEVYKGDYNYYRVTPDSDSSGSCFFVVGKEENKDYAPHLKNNLTFDVSIIFWVNMKLINETLAKNEIFTQNLIKDARRVLTEYSSGEFSHRIKNVEREFSQIYKEFTIEDTEGYMRSPYDAFRFNMEVVISEDCGGLLFDPLAALVDSLSDAEKVAVLQSLDFSNPQTVAALTPQQKTDLGI